jgi:selenocysteine lyase/cysteine desulfurase
MPDKYEPGSHNAIGLAGLAAGAAWVMEQGLEKLHAQEQDQIRAFLDGIGGIEGLTYYGPRGVANRIGVFSVRVDGYSPTELADALEKDFGVLTRPGLHCAPHIHEAIGTASAGGTTRLSFGPFISTQDIRYATDALAQVAGAVLKR